MSQVVTDESEAAMGIGAFARGLWLLREGLGMLVRERTLWGLALAPLAFSVVAIGAASALVYTHAGDLYAVVGGLLPVIEVEYWYQWIWLGPTRLLFWLIGYLLFAIVAGLSIVVAIMLATIVAAPFLDVLSQRVERIAAGFVVEAEEGGLRAILADARRSMLGDAQRMLFFALVWLVIGGIGFVIPPLHIVTAPLLLAITILFLPLEYCAYALDRRRIAFRSRRAWIFEHWPRMLGFGGASFLACFVPGLNLLMIPVLVVAGTLLVLRLPPSGSELPLPGEPAA